MTMVPFVHQHRESKWPLALALGGALAINIGVLFAIHFAPERWFDAVPDEEHLSVALVLHSPMRYFEDDVGFNSREPAMLPFTVDNKLPSDLFDTIRPDEKKLNGFLDMDDGGTALPFEKPKSGGGGGAGEASLELGYIQTGDRVWKRLKWTPDPGAAAHAAGSENGTGVSVPGTLKHPGGGEGLGNGSGSGALASQGSGSGSGAGVKGANSGAGLGTAAPLGQTRRAQLVSRSVPAYPGSARSAGHSGTVLVTIEVLPTGAVGQASVKTSSGFAELDEAAITAAKQYRFTGALQDGKAVSNWYVVPFTFALTEN